MACIVIGSLSVSFASNDVDLDSAYSKALEVEKRAIELARESKTNRCIAEKNLAVSKLIAHWEDEVPATDEEVDRWTAKGKWTCDYSEAVFR